MELKMAEMKRQFEVEQDKDSRKLRDAEHQIFQMSESLRALNGIFKTMQADENATKGADMMVPFRCYLSYVRINYSSLDKMHSS